MKEYRYQRLEVCICPRTHEQSNPVCVKQTLCKSAIPPAPSGKAFRSHSFCPSSSLHVHFCVCRYSQKLAFLVCHISFTSYKRAIHKSLDFHSLTKQILRLPLGLLQSDNPASLPANFPALSTLARYLSWFLPQDILPSFLPLIPILPNRP